MKWWDQVPWSSFSECWAFSQLFHSPLSLSSRSFLVLFTICHQGGVICISEVIDISPGNLDSSLCFFQSSISYDILWLPWWLRRLSICLQCGRSGFDPWVGKIPWRWKWQSTPALLPGKSHGQRRLVVYSPWGRKESDTIERLCLTLPYSAYKLNKQGDNIQSWHNPFPVWNQSVFHVQY